MSAPNFNDWLEICNLKARYCRCLDTKDWDGYSAVFTQDAVLDTSPSGGLRIEGREELVAYVRSSITEDTITTHHIHAPEIESNGDTATGIWATCRRPDGHTTSTRSSRLAIVCDVDTKVRGNAQVHCQRFGERAVALHDEDEKRVARVCSCQHGTSEDALLVTRRGD